MAKKKGRRRAAGYDGTGTTTHQFKDLLFNMMTHLGTVHDARGDLVLGAWSDIVGEKISKFTEAVSFTEGRLTVKVKNSTLHSLLSRNDKPGIIAALRRKFPSVQIRDIIFRLG